MKNKTLKEFRNEVGLRQKDVAAQIGISVASYSKKENGLIKVSIIESKKMSEIFNKNLDEIFLACEFQKQKPNIKKGCEI